MASIHRKYRSPFWYCQYCSADGRWLKKSTKLKDKKRAKAWCDVLQEAEDALAGRGSASEAQLRSLITTAFKKATGQEMSPTARHWFHQWIDAQRGAIAPSTLKKSIGAVESFLTFIGQKADSRLELVDRKDIIAFRALLRGSGKSATTANRTIGIVAAPLALAFRQGLVPHNPAAGIPRLKDAKVRKQPFTVEDVHKILTVAESDWKGAILAGYTTGMRLSDVANLTWDSIDFENGVIAFTQRKTDAATVVGLHYDFEEWLKSYRSHGVTAKIFPTLAGRRTGGRSGLSAQFAAIMRAAGVESPMIRTKQGKGQTVHALSFHSFRHGAASHVFSAKVVEEAQKRVTGHASADMVRRYTHVDLAAIKAAASLIPRL